MMTTLHTQTAGAEPVLRRSSRAWVQRMYVRAGVDVGVPAEPFDHRAQQWPAFIRDASREAARRLGARVRAIAGGLEDHCDSFEGFGRLLNSTYVTYPTPIPAELMARTRERVRLGCADLLLDPVSAENPFINDDGYSYFRPTGTRVIPSSTHTRKIYLGPDIRQIPRVLRALYACFDTSACCIEQIKLCWSSARTYPDGSVPGQYHNLLCLYLPNDDHIHTVLATIETVLDQAGLRTATYTSEDFPKGILALNGRALIGLDGEGRQSFDMLTTRLAFETYHAMQDNPATPPAKDLADRYRAETTRSLADFLMMPS